MYLNKAMIYGNLTRDPEHKALPSGMSVVTMSLATNRTYNDRDGKRQEQVDYHNVVVYGKTADSVSTFLRKGSAVYVEGRLQTQSWEKDGVKQYRTEVIAETIQFGPRAGGAKKEESTDQAERSVLPEYPDEEINPEDIPF